MRVGAVLARQTEDIKRFGGRRSRPIDAKRGRRQRTRDFKDGNVVTTKGARCACQTRLGRRRLRRRSGPTLPARLGCRRTMPPTAPRAGSCLKSRAMCSRRSSPFRSRNGAPSRACAGQSQARCTRALRRFGRQTRCWSKAFRPWVAKVVLWATRSPRTRFRDRDK